MTILSATTSYEATLGFMPSIILIDTDDTLATIMGTGYLNGQTLQPCGDLSASPVITNNQMALVTTSDKETMHLLVQIDGESNINLVFPSTS